MNWEDLGATILGIRDISAAALAQQENSLYLPRYDTISSPGLV